MGVYVVAIQYKYNSYHKFRMVDSRTGQIKELLALDVYRYMTNGKNPFKVEHMTINYAKDTFKFNGYDDSRVCIINDEGKATVNTDGMVVVGIEGDYVFLANYTGQIIKAHMLQVGNAVKNKKSVLVNAEILPNGRIKLKETKDTCQQRY